MPRAALHWAGVAMRKGAFELSSTAADAGSCRCRKGCWRLCRGLPDPNGDLPLVPREVRLHECRSACTLALNLPNVCVYPDNTLKFHLAYDPHNHEVNSQVSQQLVSSYPASVQARLGILKRKYKVLRGSELIALGIRDCNVPRKQLVRRLPSPARIYGRAASRTPAGKQACCRTGAFKTAAACDQAEPKEGSAALTISSAGRPGGGPRRRPSLETSSLAPNCRLGFLGDFRLLFEIARQPLGRNNCF
jgi:hypothetical protein